MKRVLVLLSLLLILLSLSACGRTTDDGNKNSQNKQNNENVESDVAIVLSSNGIEIKVGETKQLSYTLVPEGNEHISVSWKTTDDSIVSVDSNGLIVGVGKGQTNIIVSCENGSYDTCSVSVIEPSAYEQLSANEREFVDTFLLGVDSFYNPSSVTVKYIHKNSGDFGWDVTVSAQNQMGGYSEQDFDLSNDGKLSKPMLPHVDMSAVNGQSYNLDLINKAISELNNH
ncbi:MAG: Ig-like domain-containing protein [Clostridia bacterium]|nr:Ig-like domain-containing protein [Clostridia bacterium]